MEGALRVSLQFPLFVKSGSVAFCKLGNVFKPRAPSAGELETYCIPPIPCTEKSTRGPPDTLESSS